MSTAPCVGALNYSVDMNPVILSCFIMLGLGAHRLVTEGTSPRHAHRPRQPTSLHVALTHRPSHWPSGTSAHQERSHSTCQASLRECRGQHGPRSQSQPAASPAKQGIVSTPALRCVGCGSKFIPAPGASPGTVHGLGCRLVVLQRSLPVPTRYHAQCSSTRPLRKTLPPRN